MSDVYQRLAEKLNELPHGFPATESGVELKILRKIFTPEEAEMTLKLRPIPESAEAVAQRLGIPLAEMQDILDDLVLKGQIGSSKMYGQQVYMMVPFVIGIYEFQLDRMDKEFADMMAEYGPSLMGVLGKFAPALTRVIPINAQIEAKHQVHRYEDLKTTLEHAKSFQLMECICRKERALHGEPCKHPTEVCLGFSEHEGAFEKNPRGRTISKEEALKVIALADEEGLVHATFNVKSGQVFVCNCCSCCCGILRSIKYLNAPHVMAASNFRASIDQESCAACGVCATERCPVDAIVEDNGSYRVLSERCIGCGVCTPTCPTESIQLVRKPETEQDEPPENLPEWYVRRADSRGIKMVVD
jgi:Na+-translocating ferredoxin:NAD+ oxidoreductase subunit B